MLATTWVQVVKAALLMAGGVLLALLVLTHFDMNPLELFAAALQKYGARVLEPGSKVMSGQWDAISLGLGLMFGTAAMPHVLMRAYTVRDAKAAQLSIPPHGVHYRLRRHGSGRPRGCRQSGRRRQY